MTAGAPAAGQPAMLAAAHLAATFGLDPGTTVRYASSARQLLQTAAEQGPRPVPANPRTGSAQED